MTADTHDVTVQLLRWSHGDRHALDTLVPLVYRELHRQAERLMSRERSKTTLQTTVLINEVYLRLVDQKQVTWQNRAHFFGIAGQLMRRVLIDRARNRLASKRGGGDVKVTLDEGLVPVAERKIDLLALDRALERLAAIDPEQSRIVELRYFGGLSIVETAEAMGVSPATVKRAWAIAKAWLHRELTGGLKRGA